MQKLAIGGADTGPQHTVYRAPQQNPHATPNSAGAAAVSEQRPAFPVPEADFWQAIADRADETKTMLQTVHACITPIAAASWMEGRDPEYTPQLRKQHEEATQRAHDAVTQWWQNGRGAKGNRGFFKHSGKGAQGKQCPPSTKALETVIMHGAIYRINRARKLLELPNTLSRPHPHTFAWPPGGYEPSVPVFEPPV